MLKITGTEDWVRKWVSRSWPRWLQQMTQKGMPITGMIPSAWAAEVHKRQRAARQEEPTEDPPLRLPEYALSTLALVTLATHWVATHKDDVQENAYLFLKRFLARGLGGSRFEWWPSFPDPGVAFSSVADLSETLDGPRKVRVRGDEVSMDDLWPVLDLPLRTALRKPEPWTLDPRTGPFPPGIPANTSFGFSVFQKSVHCSVFFVLGPMLCVLCSESNPLCSCFGSGAECAGTARPE